MVLWPSSRISVARFYSLTFMWLSSNEGRRYRVPPNFPVRFRPSDVIEFGSDKKVAILPSFAFHFFFTFGLFLLFSQLFIRWSSSLNWCETFSCELWSTCAKLYRLCSGWRCWTRSLTNPQEVGSSRGSSGNSKSFRQHEWRHQSVSHHSYHQPHCTVQHPVRTRLCITERI